MGCIVNGLNLDSDGLRCGPRASVVGLHDDLVLAVFIGIGGKDSADVRGPGDRAALAVAHEDVMNGVAVAVAGRLGPLGCLDGFG